MCLRQSESTQDIVQIENSFRKISTQTSQTMTVRNYDGSELSRTVTRHRDGVETVAELTTFDALVLGMKKVLFREFVKNPSNGKSS